MFALVDQPVHLHAQPSQVPRLQAHSDMRSCKQKHSEHQCPCSHLRRAQSACRHWARTGVPKKARVISVRPVTSLALLRRMASSHSRTKGAPASSTSSEVVAIGRATLSLDAKTILKPVRTKRAQTAPGCSQSALWASLSH